MAYVKKKSIKGHTYYYIVESYRRNGKVKTRTLRYLGKSPAVPPEYRHVLQPRASQPMLWDPHSLGAAIARQVMRGPDA